MSITLLHQVFDETRRLAIAGSGLAEDDFRLKKLIEPLRKSGQKAPVFAKVADAAQRLIDAKPNDSATALLDLSSLVMAILYTQGELGGSGKLHKIQPVGISFTSTQTPARLLKPVIEALTTTGSGRMEIVREAHQRGVFEDPRLVNHAIAALDDVYAELADFIEQKVIVGYAAAIVPLIENNIKISGRGGDARRLRLLHRLAPEKARPIVLEAFEKGSKEMKIAGLACLGDSKEDLEPLIEQASAKSVDVRRVAVQRLVRLDVPESNTVLEACLDGNDGHNFAHLFRASKSKNLLDAILSRWDSALESLLGIDPKSRPKPAEKKMLEQHLLRLHSLSMAIPYRANHAVEKVTEQVLDLSDRLMHYKSGFADGGDLISWAAGWITACARKPLQKKLASMHATIPMVAYDECLHAAMETMTPKAFYEAFSPIYNEAVTREAKGNAKVTANRTKSQLRDCRESLTRCLEERSPLHVYRDRYSNDDDRADIRQEDEGVYARENSQTAVQLDPRWVKDAIARNDYPLLLMIATPKNTDAMKYLIDKADAGINDPKQDDYHLMLLLKKLAMCKVKQAPDLILRFLGSVSDSRKKGNKPKYGYRSLYWLGESFPYLSAPQCKQIQNALEGMHDSVVDEVLVAIARSSDKRNKLSKT
ncbi:hypothetical protein [Stieleria varia]|uniref:HEAT repeat protein n=1 Tax=Stieleria varia TaxID=2528005 RepID=A0A5C5ZYU2_9BACT|nr:hypothetical protein [Stieleria varia]TWT92346.1 hypothetical protein Pla52n_62200 [Stieleria varia]